MGTVAIFASYLLLSGTLGFGIAWKVGWFLACRGACNCNGSRSGKNIEQLSGDGWAVSSDVSVIRSDGG
jgi:hypothetical protein